jgi:hypothetical protein
VPVEPKPLFRPDIVRPHVAAFSLPEHAAGSRTKIARWADLLSGPEGDRVKERELLPVFLSDVFTELLGYGTLADNPARHTLSREQHVEVDGQYADAVLGEFGAGARRFVVAIEGKGPRDPLDRPFAGRRLSAVEQRYRYAVNLPCDWILVTSMRETRLYFKGSDQQTYERFEISRLAHDEDALKRFVFLLGAERVVPLVGLCHLYGLRTSSEQSNTAITRAYYQRYAEIRYDAFTQLVRDNREVERSRVLAATQLLLDRVLFCAFAEDRRLLPAETIQTAFEHRDPYQPRPVWENFKGLFRFVNEGNRALQIPAYNGGLFAAHAILDSLVVSDQVCGYFRELAGYDYRSASEVSDQPRDVGQMIDVDILGHIFEQSITDLERLKSGDVDDDPDRHRARRKREGAFYTPTFITRYIVEQTLGPLLGERYEQLRAGHQQGTVATARAALNDPRVYALETLNRPQREILIRFWESWQRELASIRLLDPACGSGAFLIEAFDQLHRVYEESNDRLEELRGSRTLFDLDREILQNNLYGVDLNPEAIEICRLSLWIKTAERGKILTSLDHTIRVGNSIISDPDIDRSALDWNAAFPEVFASGGFDAVIGNPPYVRQETLAPLKPYLEKHYRAYHGSADLYVYFYEVGLRLLKPGARLSFVVTNKWLKANYGESLRRLFADHAWVESIIDFGHAKQIFAEADVFPSIIVVRKPDTAEPPQSVRVCAIPREQLRIHDLVQQIGAEGFDLPRTTFNSSAWMLEPPAVARLLAKIQHTGTPLREFAGTRLYRGLLTGLNEAFVINSDARAQLIHEDPSCDALIRPFVRGQDIRRWRTSSSDLWLIAIESSGDREWVWSQARDAAEAVFARTFPSIFRHLGPFKAAAIARQDKGRFWWELRSCAYWDKFLGPKLFYQEIQFHPWYAFDESGLLANNKCFFIPIDDLYLLGVLNSPLMWWHNFRYLPHMKDEALSPVTFKMEVLPIAVPTDDVRTSVESAVRRLIEQTGALNGTRGRLADWLRVEYEVSKPTLRLQAALDLDEDGFVAEIRKARGKGKPLTAAGLHSVREEYRNTVEPARVVAEEMLRLEEQIADWVYRAYGLTRSEIELVQRTAPPRMPLSGYEVDTEEATFDEVASNRPS